MNASSFLSLISVLALILFALYCFFINYCINDKNDIGLTTSSVWQKIFLPPK